MNALRRVHQLDDAAGRPALVGCRLLLDVHDRGRMKMSHMIADSIKELLAIADTIGLSRRWLQKAGTSREHFDISLSLRTKGAAGITKK
jgi:hypothetical protein